MIPNTFESYNLIGRSICKTDFIVGHVTKIKSRDSVNYQYMSEVGGARNTKKGLTMVGARYSLNKIFNFGAYVEYGWDLWNTVYAEAQGKWKLGDQWGLSLAAQYIDQRSVGKKLAGDFNTYAWGGSVALSYKGVVFTYAFTSTGLGSQTLNPYGGHPGFTSVLIKDFNRAGENAWLLGLSYDFSRWGLNGLGAITRFVLGDTPGSGRAASPDQNEFDLTVDFCPQKGLRKGLGLRVSTGLVNQYGPRAQDEMNIRVILNYDLPVL